MRLFFAFPRSLCSSSIFNNSSSFHRSLPTNAANVYAPTILFDAEFVEAIVASLQQFMPDFDLAQIQIFFGSQTFIL
jgi:hypothetical protein